MIILARLLHMRINLLLHNLHVQYCQLVQHSQFGHPGEAQVELHDEALALAGLGSAALTRRSLCPAASPLCLLPPGGAEERGHGVRGPHCVVVAAGILAHLLQPLQGGGQPLNIAVEHSTARQILHLFAQYVFNSFTFLKILKYSSPSRSSSWTHLRRNSYHQFS